MEFGEAVDNRHRNLRIDHCPVSGQDPETDPPLLQLLDERNQIEKRAAEPVELPGNEHIPFPAAAQRGGQPSSVGRRAGRLILEYELATGCAQDLNLQIEILLVG